MINEKQQAHLVSYWLKAVNIKNNFHLFAFFVHWQITATPLQSDTSIIIFQSFCFYLDFLKSCNLGVFSVFFYKNSFKDTRIAPPAATLLWFACLSMWGLTADVEIFKTQSSLWMLCIKISHPILKLLLNLEKLSRHHRVREDRGFGIKSVNIFTLLADYSEVISECLFT